MDCEDVRRLLGHRGWRFLGRLAAQSVGRKELPRADEKAVGSAAPSVVESVEMMAA